MFDIEAAQTEKVAAALAVRSRECERGIVAFRADGNAGIALVAPDSLILAVAWCGGAMITDHFLN